MKTGKRTIAMLLAVLMAFSVLSVAVMADGASETEPNNSYDKANAVTVDTAIEGSLSTTADKDWYTFTAGADGTAKIKLTHTASSTDTVYFTASVFTAANAATGTSSELKLESKGTDASKEGTFAVKKDTVYCIRIDTLNGNAVNVKYALTCSGFTAGGSGSGGTTTGDAEAEPNNAPSTATVLTLGKLFSGSLSSAEDVDYYSFISEGESVLNLEFSHAEQAGQTGTYFNIAVYDSKNEKVADASSTGIQTVISLKDVDLVAGTYYVAVTKGFVASTITYQIGVTLTAAPATTSESEDNNTPEDANKLKFGKPMVGALTETASHKQDYRDYYYFTINAKGVLELSFNHEVSTAADNGNVYFVVALYSNKTNQLYSVTSKGTDAEVNFPNLILDPGTYYVCVSNDTTIASMEYSVEVNVLGYSGSESEPNDTYDKANSIKTGTLADSKAYLAEITDDNDTDLYKFNASSQGYAYISFTNLASEKGTDFTVSVCKQSSGSGEVKMEVIKSFTVDSEDNDCTSACIGLESGEYYVMVTGKDADASAYAVAVRYSAFAYYETELNDSIDNADKFSDKNSIQGSSFDANDADYFVFKFDEEMVFTITGERAYTTAEKTAGVVDSEECKWTVYLYVPEMGEEPVKAFTFTNAKNGAATMEIRTDVGDFKSGDYYLCVKPTSGSYGNMDYKITVTSESNTAVMNVIERVKSFVARLKAIDWSNLKEQFAWMKQYLNADSVKVFGKAIKGLIDFISKLFN